MTCRNNPSITSFVYVRLNGTIRPSSGINIDNTNSSSNIKPYNERLHPSDVRGTDQKTGDIKAPRVKHIPPRRRPCQLVMVFGIQCENSFWKLVYCGKTTRATTVPGSIFLPLALLLLMGNLSSRWTELNSNGIAWRLC